MSSVHKDDASLDPETDSRIGDEQDAQLGVKTVEAAEKVYGRYSKWFLFIGYVSFLMSHVR